MYGTIYGTRTDTDTGHRRQRRFNLSYYLTVANISWYCPENATPTIIRHMTQVQQGLRSTKSARSIALAAILREPGHPASENHIDPSTALFNFITAPTNELQVCIVPTATLFTDDMGCFPIRAMSGNQYIMLAYHGATNAILLQPFQTKADHHCIPAFNIIMEWLKARISRLTRKYFTTKQAPSTSTVSPTNGNARIKRSHWICTAATRQNGPSGPSKPTSSPSWPAFTQHLLRNDGIYCSLKRNSPSTSCSSQP